MGLLPLRHPLSAATPFPMQNRMTMQISQHDGCRQTGMRDGRTGCRNKPSISGITVGISADVGVYRHGEYFSPIPVPVTFLVVRQLGLAGIVVACSLGTPAVVGPLNSGLPAYFGLPEFVSAGQLLRSTFEPQIPIDPKNRIIAIVGDGFSRRIPWTQISDSRFAGKPSPGIPG
jgi:hypothetical protein